jgi:deazaflavin-dependent oxidoreductase (nitroreductase family)
VLDADRLMTRLNPAVGWLLRSRFHPLASWGLALLHVTGRKSGRRYWIPVGYQRHGATVIVLVSHASRKQWWRNYREPGPVELILRGRVVHGRAKVLPPDSEAFRTAMDGTFRRIPGLGRQFGIRRDRKTGLTAEQARTVARDGAIVSIVLEPTSPSATTLNEPTPA